MSGGKGKSHGGKAGPKGGDASRQQVSHSAKAGLQVRNIFFSCSVCFRWSVPGTAVWDRLELSLDEKYSDWKALFPTRYGF
jgi:hypothetical protein